VYRAFRAPTLNELYRPFQVGTILTAANPALNAETLTGGELGIEGSPVRGLTARLTGFANALDAPIVNVSLADGTRQRQNLGAARIIGLEASAEWRFAHDFLFTAGYSLIDARVVSGPEGLPGKQLPQDPAHRFSATMSYANLRWVTVVVQVRVLSASFEDDRNTLPLPAFAVLDASILRSLGKGLELFAAAQNVLGTSYLVGRAGIDTVGPPFSFRAGLRLRGDAR
jgi:outer membrane receptor protein involved in Fe transport